ncbi:TIGR04028 family ABC transporter substrate-binding protein [Mesorhizobium sp. 2RAF21]|uniref:TIGR04028 family ABC transporter substrate-binding protein n=1 Tax=Mesorhizobium sp. 2RAF21 TaxID=3232995 RepID=UPI003F9B3C06
MKPHRKLISLGLAALATSLIPFAATAADSPVKGGTLVYLEQQGHTNLYPPNAGLYSNGGILNQITDKLTYQNPKTLEIEPWLAESWQVNDNATEYTFKLRPGVTFSDGTPVDAAVVAKNFDTFGLGNKELKQPISEVVNNYERSEVVDPLTVKFHFKKPSPGFLQGTSVIGTGIVSLSTLALPFEQFGDATKIIGSGPFVVSAETIGKTLDLKAREDYNWGPAKLEHQGRAYLDEIKYIIAGEDSVRIGALLAEQADFIRQIQAYDEQRVEEQGFSVYAPGTRGVNNSIAFRADNPLVSDVKVRKALSLAVNRDEIISTLFSKNYPKATSILASAALGYVPQTDKLQFDPEKAKALLDEAGFKVGADGIREKDGQKLILTGYASLPQPQSRSTLQLIAQQWAKIGVTFNVLAGDSGSQTVDELDPYKTPVAVGIVGRADPDVVKSQFYPTLRNLLLQKGGTSDKVNSFVDEKLNAILDEIASQPNLEKRLKAVEEAQAYLLDQAYVIPIFEEPQVFAGAPYVKGIGFEAVGRPAFYSTWLDK